MKAPFIPVVAALALLTGPSTVQAQHVSLDIGIRQGPVAGRIIVGHPGYYHSYYPYRIYRPPIVVVRPHLIAVHRGHRGHGWYRHHGYRRVTVWHDRGHDRWYDRHGEYRDGLREVTVYERGGRYYWPDRDDDHDDDHDDDYYDRYDRD